MRKASSTGQPCLSECFRSSATFLFVCLRGNEDAVLHQKIHQLCCNREPRCRVNIRMGQVPNRKLFEFVEADVVHVFCPKELDQVGFCRGDVIFKHLFTHMNSNYHMLKQMDTLHLGVPYLFYANEVNEAQYPRHLTFLNTANTMKLVKAF